MSVFSIVYLLCLSRILLNQKNQTGDDSAEGGYLVFTPNQTTIYLSRLEVAPPLSSTNPLLLAKVLMMNTEEDEWNNSEDDEDERWLSQVWGGCEEPVFRIRIRSDPYHWPGSGSASGNVDLDPGTKKNRDKHAYKSTKIKKKNWNLVGSGSSRKRIRNTERNH